MTEAQEKRNQRIALFTTVGVHGLLALLFFFLVAWRAPDPPLPEYGIELNFGMDTQGSGEVQPETPVGSEGTQEEEPQQPDPVEEQPQEEAQPVEPQPTEQELVSKIESPVKVEEKKEEVKQPEKKVEKKETPPEKEVPKKVDENSVYKPNKQTTASANKTDEGKAGAAGSHGDDKGKTGDKGDPKGSLDSKALYGQPGGGSGGSSLELSGWAWDTKPSPNVPNNESGRVVFEIKVDDNGDIVSIKTIERSVSLEAEQACRRAVEKLTFSKIGENVPAISTGKITFVIRAK